MSVLLKMLSVPPCCGVPVLLSEIFWNPTALGGGVGPCPTTPGLPPAHPAATIANTLEPITIGRLAPLLRFTVILSTAGADCVRQLSSRYRPLSMWMRSFGDKRQGPTVTGP